MGRYEVDSKFPNIYFLFFKQIPELNRLESL
jgi:hypothetical protein